MGIRYEQYTSTKGQPFFTLNDNIKRTSIIDSKNNNWHENLELQFCKEGEGFVLIDGESHAFKKGDIAIIDSNSLHHTYSDTDMVYACIIVNTEFCSKMEIDHKRLSFTPIVQSEELTYTFDEICRIYSKNSPLRVARLNHLLLGLLIRVVTDHSTPKMCEDTNETDLSVAKRVILFLRESFDQKITLDAIAKHTLTDKYTLCKIFKRITGQTIFENLNTYRCIRAAEYISEGKSISEAASLCGFESNSFFTKTFKKHIGILPSKITASAEQKQTVGGKIK